MLLHYVALGPLDKVRGRIIAENVTVTVLLYSYC